MSMGQKSVVIVASFQGYNIPINIFVRKRSSKSRFRIFNTFSVHFYAAENGSSSSSDEEKEEDGLR